MSGLSKSDYDYINLGVCIKGQADRLGIEHEGIPLEGVVVRLANATPPGSERAEWEPSDAEWEYGNALINTDGYPTGLVMPAREGEVEDWGLRRVRRRAAGPWELVEEKTDD